MPINPLYAKAMNSGGDRESNPPVKFTEIGDKVVGVITRVGGAFQANNKFWKEGDPEYLKTKTTQPIDIRTADGTVTLWLNNSSMFAAIGEALIAANRSDLTPGWTLGFKWSSVKTNPKGGAMLRVWEARLAPPTA